MSQRGKRFTLIGLGLVCVLAAAVWLTKREADRESSDLPAPCSQPSEANNMQTQIEPAAVARDLAERFSRPSAAGDYAVAASQVVGNADAMNLLKATCDLRLAWTAFHKQLASSYGQEAADQFPREGQMLFITAIATLDGPRLLLLSEPSMLQDVGCQEVIQEGLFMTVCGDRIARMVHSEGLWRLSMEWGADHKDVMLAGFDAIAGLYNRFAAELSRSQIPIETLRSNISNAFDEDARIRVLHDTAVRAGFAKGMPMP